MIHNMINSFFFLDQVLHCSQMLNFALNHDHKFETIIMIKDVQIIIIKMGESVKDFWMV
jgi:hypothetical protein